VKKYATIAVLASSLLSLLFVRSAIKSDSIKPLNCGLPICRVRLPLQNSTFHRRRRNLFGCLFQAHRSIHKKCQWAGASNLSDRTQSLARKPCTSVFLPFHGGPFFKAIKKQKYKVRDRVYIR
jgi:hypothetical protein